MSSIEIVNTVVASILVISGILGIGTTRRKNQWLVNLITPLGYRILLVVLGMVFLYVTWFTNYFSA